MESYPSRNYSILTNSTQFFEITLTPSERGRRGEKKWSLVSAFKVQKLRGPNLGDVLEQLEGLS